MRLSPRRSGLPARPTLRTARDRRIFTAASETGAPTITHPAPAFNLMACANQDDKNTPTRADDWISGSSSRGPTVGGRKKPDIGAPGTNILSCNKNWTPTSLWSGCTGTSCAAPH